MKKLILIFIFLIFAYCSYLYFSKPKEKIENNEINVVKSNEKLKKENFKENINEEDIPFFATWKSLIGSVVLYFLIVYFIVFYFFDEDFEDLKENKFQSVYIIIFFPLFIFLVIPFFLSMFNKKETFSKYLKRSLFYLNIQKKKILFLIVSWLPMIFLSVYLYYPDIKILFRILIKKKHQVEEEDDDDDDDSDIYRVKNQTGTKVLGIFGDNYEDNDVKKKNRQHRKMKYVKRNKM